MLRKAYYITYTIFALWALALLALCVNGNITFEAGLGDLFFFVFLIALSTSLTGTTVLYFMGRITKPAYPYMMISVMLTTMFYFTLKSTFWRDSEYRWNGKVFYKPIGK